MRELEKLTEGERLFIWRRRLGQNQTEAADSLGVARHEYGLMELDKKPVPERLRIRGRALADHEVCVLYRRRCGKTQAWVAREMGVCRYWINRMENGSAPVDRLIEFWEV